MNTSAASSNTHIPYVKARRREVSHRQVVDLVSLPPFPQLLPLPCLEGRLSSCPQGGVFGTMV